MGNPWTCLIRLTWLTGDDGRVAFWKVAYLVLVVMFAAMLWHVFALLDAAIEREAALRDVTGLLWPVLWLFSLFLLMSFGIKGAQLWATTARLKTDAAFRFTQEHRAVTVRAERDATLGIDPAP